MLPLNETPCCGAKVACYDDLTGHEQQQFMSMVWLQVPPRRTAKVQVEKKKGGQTDFVSQWYDLMKSYYFWWYR